MWYIKNETSVFYPTLKQQNLRSVLIPFTHFCKSSPRNECLSHFYVPHFTFIPLVLSIASSAGNNNSFSTEFEYDWLSNRYPLPKLHKMHTYVQISPTNMNVDAINIARRILVFVTVYYPLCFLLIRKTAYWERILSEFWCENPHGFRALFGILDKFNCRKVSVILWILIMKSWHRSKYFRRC